MLGRFATLLGVVLVAAGCLPAQPRKPEPASGFVTGTSLHTIDVGGRDRTYRLYRPTGLPGFGSAEQAERSYCWDQLADSAKFVVAYPDGNRAWNVNGGIMSYTLACNTDVFAAIGPDAATQLDPCRSPHPTSVMHIHGTADVLVPYRGGQGFSVINGPPVPRVNAFWRGVDQCASRKPPPAVR